MRAEFLKLNFSDNITVHILLLVLSIVVIYSNTLAVPFLFDDEPNITSNEAITGFKAFLDASSLNNMAVNDGVKEFFYTRYIGYLTFALNYKFHGLNVTGYHIFNIAIHIINSLLVYWFAILTFRTPYFKSLQNYNNTNLIAFFSALIFAVHPIQTQAVTYIVQRFASLATLFYLFSLVFYIKSRLLQQPAVCGQKSSKKQGLESILWYLFSIFCAVLSMGTKEISFTLPVMIVIYEVMFFEGDVRKRLIYLIPILLTLAIIPLTLIGAKGILVGINIMDESMRIVSSEIISRQDYFFTQLRVIVTYLRLLFFPVNQNLDHDYPVYHSFIDPPVFLSFLFLLSILIFGIYLIYQSRKSENASYLRLISFGILWFFITVSVESSIIPRPEIIFEHRIYLSSVGFIIAVITFFILDKEFFGKRIQWMRKVMLTVFVAVVLAFSSATYARNMVWQSEIALWKDAVKKSPQKARPHNNLGFAYKEKDFFDEAIREYLTAVKLKRDFVDAYNNLGVAYREKGVLDKAETAFQESIRLNNLYVRPHYNLGVVYEKQGRYDMAIREYRIAIQLRPDYIKAQQRLNAMIENRVKLMEDAASKEPQNSMLHYNLGIMYDSLGYIDKAIEEYQLSVRLKYGNADAHNNLGAAYLKQGNLDEAIKEFRIALKLKPHDIDISNNLKGAEGLGHNK